MPFWGDLNARARGLGNHLLGRARLETLAGAGTVEHFVAELVTFDPQLPRQPVVLPQDLDLYFRRVAADHLTTIARWADRRHTLLTIVFEDEDRRSLRALLRGSVQGVAPERRVAGLIPTPALPVRALAELAQVGSPAEVSDLLGIWRSPYAAVLLPEAKKHQPDMLILESSINVAFVERARREARHGDRYLKRFVERVIDLENLWSAAVLAERGGDPAPERFFLEGGTILSEQMYRSAITESSQWRSAVRAALDRTPLAEVVTDSPEPTSLEASGLLALLGEAVRESLLDPLSAAPLLAFVLRLRAQLMDLRSLMWGILLGVDARRLRAGLITPW